MKQTLGLWKKVYDIDAKIKFKPPGVVKFRNTVSGKGMIEKARGCTNEFTILMNCLRDNFYDNTFCTEQSKDFTQCYQNYMQQQQKSREANKSSLPAYSTTYTTTQINNYLKHYDLKK